MGFDDNSAKIFVVIIFMTLEEAQIIGEIIPNLIVFFCTRSDWILSFNWKNG
tara:strand:+ start:2385 stop:2540 length:156 start_codon:yes stop_codon:yes gene_type:complete